MPQNEQEQKAATEFYKGIIDSGISHLLESFHEIPANDAINALHILSQQKMLDSTATDYCELPLALRLNPYEKIQESLKKLHLIMQNGQPEKAPTMFEACQSAESLISAIMDLNLEQRTVILNSVFYKLPKIINNFSDFHRAMLELTPDQCKIVCSGLNDKIPLFIDSFLDFFMILEIEKFKAVCNGLDVLKIFQNTHYDKSRKITFNPEQLVIYDNRIKELLAEQESKNKRTYVETTGLFSNSNLELVSGSNKRQKVSVNNPPSPRP